MYGVRGGGMVRVVVVVVVSWLVRLGLGTILHSHSSPSSTTSCLSPQTKKYYH